MLSLYVDPPHFTSDQRSHLLLLLNLQTTAFSSFSGTMYILSEAEYQNYAEHTVSLSYLALLSPSFPHHRPYHL